MSSQAVSHYQRVTMFKQQLWGRYHGDIHPTMCTPSKMQIALGRMVITPPRFFRYPDCSGTLPFIPRKRLENLNTIGITNLCFCEPRTYSRAMKWTLPKRTLWWQKSCGTRPFLSVENPKCCVCVSVFNNCPQYI